MHHSPPQEVMVVQGLLYSVLVHLLVIWWSSSHAPSSAWKENIIMCLAIRLVSKFVGTTIQVLTATANKRSAVTTIMMIPVAVFAGLLDSILTHLIKNM